MRRVAHTAVRQAEPSDLPAVLNLLEQNGLPDAGAAKWISNFTVLSDGEAIKAAAGYERYADHALLRSVVVSEDARNTGIGDILVSAVLKELRAKGIRDVFLLTTTAENFFAKRGFTPVERDAVPGPLLASEEFTHACPSTASVMRRELAD